MDNKNLFLNWIDNGKIKDVTVVEFIEALETSFDYLKLNVWDISNPKEFSNYRNKLLDDKKFKKSNKNLYSIIKNDSKYYQKFLESSFNNEEIDTKNVDKYEMRDTTLIDTKSVYDFFNDDILAEKFIDLCVYAISKDDNLELDIRASIIGMKKNGERLRFYCDKNGLCRIKVSSTKSDPVKMVEYDNAILYKMIDESCEFFMNNSEIVKLDYSKNKCIYHNTFGFGIVEHETNNSITVVFDESKEKKEIKLNHSSYKEISYDDYLNKRIPSFEEENETNSKRILWDKYESALLIEAYIDIEEKHKKRDYIIKSLSSNLRKRAVNQGMEIDSIFRNENGISYKLAEIKRCFNPDLGKMHSPKIYDEMVDIYLNNRPIYVSILEEAHKQVDASIIKPVENDVFSLSIDETDLYTYVSEKYYKKHLEDGKYKNADKHAKKSIIYLRKLDSIFKTSILKTETVENINDYLKRIEKCKSEYEEEDFKWYIYVLKIVKEYKNNNDIENTSVSDYKRVILKCFPEGYAYDNILRKKRFIREYSEVVGKEFNDSDEIYHKIIKKLGFIYEDKVYIEDIVPLNLKEEIKGFIDDNLNKYSAIYYSVIFDKFSNCLHGVFNLEMLKAYIKYVFDKKYNFNDSYLCVIGKNLNLKNDIINVFLNQGCALDISDLYRLLPSVSSAAIDSVINDRDFIVNYRGKSYFYKDVFSIETDELQQIREFIEKTIDEKAIVSGSELNEYIRVYLPELIERNPYITEYGLKNITKYYLGSVYNFKGDVISSMNEQIDVKTLFSDFCMSRDKFSFDDLESYRKSINKNYIDWDSVLKNSVRINKNEFVNFNKINFPSLEIDSAINEYINDGYASFLDIINFHNFPVVEYNWNVYLLESYVYNFSKKFRLLHASFNGEKPIGAIVSNESGIDNFGSLLKLVIKKNKLFNIDYAFDYLIENDFIKTRKIKDLDLLIEEAKKE